MDEKQVDDSKWFYKIIFFATLRFLVPYPNSFSLYSLSLFSIKNKSVCILWSKYGVCLNNAIQRPEGIFLLSSSEAIWSRDTIARPSIQAVLGDLFRLLFSHLYDSITVTSISRNRILGIHDEWSWAAGKAIGWMNPSRIVECPRSRHFFLIYSSPPRGFVRRPLRMVALSEEQTNVMKASGSLTPPQPRFSHPLISWSVARSAAVDRVDSLPPKCIVLG